MPEDSAKTTWTVGSTTLVWLLRPQDDAQPPYPSRVGEYEILGVIGEGGNGVVLRARHPRTGAMVALKIIRPDRCTPDGVSRFEVEWRTVLQLKHRSIASVIDCGRYESESGSAPFYVMELITDGEGGQPLGLLEFAKKHRLTIEQRVALMIQVCGAVQTAHDRGVIHRDLKPGNIPVDEADRSADDGPQRLGVPKVVDFGLAHVLGAAIVDRAKETPGRQFAGTLRYMAPEQVRGATGEIGPWTDVYALGLIAFELLTQGFPYELEGLSDTLAFERIQTAARVRAESLEPRVGHELSDLLMHAIEISAGSRIQTAGELRRGLETWLDKRRVQEGVARVARRKAESLMVPLMFLASVLAAGAAYVGIIATSLDYRYLNAPFQRWLCQLYPPMADASFEDVRVVALDESFNDQTTVDKVCRDLGLEGLRTNAHGGFRPLYARIARLIIEAGKAKVVAIDIAFEGETPFDTAAAEDLAAVNTPARNRTGPSIVVGMPYVEFDPTTDLPSEMSTTIARCAPFFGGLSGHFNSDACWSVDLLVQRNGGAPIASLAAMTYAKSKDGTGTPTFSMCTPDIPSHATLGPSPGNPNGRELDLASTPVEKIERDPVNERLGLSPGDRVDRMLFAVPSERTLRDATVSMEVVAAAAAAGEEGRSRLWALFNNKSVIIGDTRRTRSDHLETDLKEHASGRDIAGVYAHATATQWLLDGREIRTPGLGMALMLTWVLSAAGVCIVWHAARRKPETRGDVANLIRAVIGLFTVGAVWMICVFGLYYWGLWMIHPWVPLCGLALGAIFAWILVRFGYAAAGDVRAQGAPA